MGEIISGYRDNQDSSLNDYDYTEDIYRSLMLYYISLEHFRDGLSDERPEFYSIKSYNNMTSEKFRSLYKRKVKGISVKLAYELLVGKKYKTRFGYLIACIKKTFSFIITITKKNILTKEVRAGLIVSFICWVAWLIW